MASRAVKLKAVWRIEGEAKVFSPGDTFRAEADEAERLVRIGAAILFQEEPEAGS